MAIDSIRNFFSTLLQPLFSRKRNASVIEIDITDDEENVEGGPSVTKRMKASHSSELAQIETTNKGFQFAAPLKPLESNASNIAAHASYTSSILSRKRSQHNGASEKTLSRVLPKSSSYIQRNKNGPWYLRHFGFPRSADPIAATRKDTIRLKEKEQYKQLIKAMEHRSFNCPAPITALVSGSLVLDKLTSPDRARYFPSGSPFGWRDLSSRLGKKEVEVIDISGEDGPEKSSRETSDPASSSLLASTYLSPLNDKPSNVFKQPTASTPLSAIKQPALSKSLIFKDDTLFTTLKSETTAYASTSGNFRRRTSTPGNLSIDITEGLEEIKNILDRSLGTKENPILVEDDQEAQRKAEEELKKSFVSPSKSSPLVIKRPSLNSLSKELEISDYAKPEWLQSMIRERAVASRERQEKIEREQKTLEILRTESTLSRDLAEQVRRNLTLTDIIELEAPTEEIKLPEITDEMQAIIDDACSPGPMQHVIMRTQNNVAITKSDVKSLAPLQWLNDNVIDAYMDLIVRRSKTNSDWPLVYAFTTFFYPKLLNEGYSNILKRWTRKVDIFSYDLLLFPIHLGAHWCLATADKRTKIIKYYDSLGGKNHQCCKVLLDYLCKEHMERKKEPLDSTEWKLEIVPDIPQQQNGSDCGMFTCKFAEYLSRNADLTFTQEEMNYYRARMIYEIIGQDILHP